jgi:hypothetical protein
LMIRSGRMRDTCKIPSCCSKIKGSFSNIWKISEQSRNSGWTNKGYKGHLYLYFQSVQSMYASEHIVTLSSGDLRVSDHPVVVQMLNFTHVLEILCRTGPDIRDSKKRDSEKRAARQGMAGQGPSVRPSVLQGRAGGRAGRAGQGPNKE